MTGDAYRWHAGESLADETANRNTTCADWQVRLKKFYGKTRSLALDELEGRRMQEGEAPLNFVRDVLRLCTEVDPGMDDDTRLRHLQRSLPPPVPKGHAPDGSKRYGCLHRKADEALIGRCRTT